MVVAGGVVNRHKIITWSLSVPGTVHPCFGAWAVVRGSCVFSSGNNGVG